MHRYLLVVSLVLILPFAAEAKGEWQKAGNNDCLLWNADPQPGERVTWTGKCLDGKAEGQGVGTWSFRKGRKRFVVRYHGEMHAGNLHGQGTLFGENGYRAEGEWKNGKFHGTGTMYESNGTRYEGQWRDGKQQGKGSFTAPNGDRYEGRWLNGKKHGRGAYYFVAGDRYTGPFQNDKLHGIGVCFDKNEGNRGCEWRHGEFVRWID